MIKKLSLTLIVILLTGIIAGCGKGSEYEGKWVGLERSEWDGTLSIKKLDIKKNGENYIISSTREYYQNIGQTLGAMAVWKVDSESFKPVSAGLKDGRLIFDSPMGAMSWTFIKSDGTILDTNGVVYKKETPEEVTILKNEATKKLKQVYPKITITEE